MKAQNKPFSFHSFDGAGHGFLRQTTPENVEASKRAWPYTVNFFKTFLEAR
jgi:dienelactone hydrolase